ncbi:MAG: glycoside hydrolase family 130 protein [Desulfobacterota bacterium]|nr:glycoside hydrolase family 130 protein [Thermodesulfobacteriota bacterium]
MVTVKRKRKKIVRDPSRVITRLHLPKSVMHARRIIRRVLKLEKKEVMQVLRDIYDDFSDRHRDIDNVFLKHFYTVQHLLPDKVAHLDDHRKKLIGAYFTMEYAVESAAIFNPSIVLHPDQSDLEQGQIRFIMSLRAVGEGHISSIEFRSGIIDEDTNIIFDPLHEFVEHAELQLNPLYDRHLFELKLNEMQICDETTHAILRSLPDQFSFSMLRNSIESFEQEHPSLVPRQEHAIETMLWLARSNYELTFNPDSMISERVIFPASENDRSGIEDARFVRFTDDDGTVMYYATYTAYNGSTILPQLIETKDFVTFKMITLNGRAVQNKGMALFPRRINGKYVMLSRQDNENNHIMFSDHLHFWQRSEILQRPTYPWELIQIGNCGSPLETPDGWLVLTHGVGPMRRYCIGAMLLDLENPRRIIGMLTDPLLEPREEEREGYVPNVVYSCGSIIHRDQLIIPYAMSDTMAGIATVSVDELLSAIKRI